MYPGESRNADRRNTKTLCLCVDPEEGGNGREREGTGPFRLQKEWDNFARIFPYKSSIMGSDKSAKKEKKAKRESTGGGDDGIPEVKAEYLAPIASPLADDKLSKKVRWCPIEPNRIYERRDARGRCGSP